MSRLPPLRQIRADSSGWGFFLCAQKDVRVGRGGDFIALTLQDKTGQVSAKIFDDVERWRGEFDAGDFVKVQGRGNLYNGRLQFIVENLRRVNREQDRAHGFREDDCVPSAPRPLDEMWTELQALLAGVQNSFLKELLQRIVGQHEPALRVWPAAQTVHHAYRGGFLEHVLQVARVGTSLARLYDADADLVVAGALLHDIGKLQELDYDVVAGYSREGNLVGHIALGVILVREAASAIPGFPEALRTQIEHLVVSHHGCLEFGSPVEPKTVEAFIVSMADDLDAKVNQVRQAVQGVGGDAEFTAYHRRLGRVLWKG